MQKPGRAVELLLNNRSFKSCSPISALWPGCRIQTLDGYDRYTFNIDLTVREEGLTLSVLFAIENDLDDLLLPYKIDRSILHEIENIDLVAHINWIGCDCYDNVEEVPYGR